MKKTITTFVALSLLTTGVSYAQDGATGAPGRPGERIQQIREDRKEIREDFREDRKEAMGEFKEAIKERRVWNANNASGTATGTKPTPWKDLRGEMKDMRKDAREDFKEVKAELKDIWKDMRGAFPPKMATLTEVQTAAIAGKLGLTVEALKLQLASGTKLKEIIKDKILPDEMRQILPPRIATITRPVVESGIINSWRARLLGERREEIQQIQDEFGEIKELARPVQGAGFLRRLFNW